MDANFGPEVRELGRGLRDGSQRTADTTRWYKGLKGNSGAGRVKWDRSWGEVGIPGGINNMKGSLKQSCGKCLQENTVGKTRVTL